MFTWVGYYYIFVHHIVDLVEGQLWINFSLGSVWKLLPKPALNLSCTLSNNGWGRSHDSYKKWICSWRSSRTQVFYEILLKQLHRWSFLVKFAKVLRKAFLQNTSGQLHLMLGFFINFVVVFSLNYKVKG